MKNDPRHCFLRNNAGDLKNREQEKGKRKLNIPFDPNQQKYPSQRYPIYARNGMVNCSSPMASAAGLEILRRGGLVGIPTETVYGQRTGIRRICDRLDRKRPEAVRTQRQRSGTDACLDRKDSGGRPGGKRENARPRLGAGHRSGSRRSMAGAEQPFWEAHAYGRSDAGGILCRRGLSV